MIRPSRPTPTSLDEETPPRRSSLGRPERAVATFTTAALLAIGLGVLAHTLVQVWSTANSTCELVVTLPTRHEVPGIDDQGLAVSGGYTSARFVLCDADATAQAQLAVSQFLSAATIAALLLTVALTGVRILRDRPLLPGLVGATAVTGGVMVVLPLISRALSQSAHTTFARQLREHDFNTVFPQDVAIELNVPAVAAGVALLLLAVLLRLLQRSVRDLEGLI